MFLRVFTTPLITTLADRSGDRANVLTFLVAASAFLSLGYFLPVSYAMALIVSLLLAHLLDPAFADCRFCRFVGRSQVGLQLHQDAHLGVDLLPDGQPRRRPCAVVHRHQRRSHPYYRRAGVVSGGIVARPARRATAPRVPAGARRARQGGPLRPAVSLYGHWRGADCRQPFLHQQLHVDLLAVSRLQRFDDRLFLVVQRGG